MLEASLLGTFDVRHGEKSITIASRPAQSLFAYLILTAGTSHRREKLAGLLWPDSLEQTARDNLHHALWKVRKALSTPQKPKTEYILADDLSIAFNAASEYWLDAATLEKVDEGASADVLISVLSTYQGELLPGFYDEWVTLEREHLNSIFEHHMARLMSLLQDEKRWLDVLDWGERWIKLGQKPEAAFRALMSAHAMKGDMSKVVVTYERCVKSLKEFGVAPSEQTRELYNLIKARKETLEAGKGTIVKEKRNEDPLTNLPVPVTSFIGRKKETKEIAELLLSCRLLTMMGAGGVGKTRLAIQVANDSINKFKDGIFWVELVGLSDANLVPQEVARSLQVREIRGMPLIETLKTELANKNLLLIFDNCEHLIDAVAWVAEQLLSMCPNLKILATSRERLAIFNETVWYVPSLSENTSRQLFVERARVVKHDIVLSDSNEVYITQICERLDRIPLAIELAAARLGVLSLEEIAKRLNSIFSLLTSGSRTALARQQTLRATIDWSFDLLTGPERILFRRLSVFAGSFTLEATESVCGYGELKRNEILDLLGRLVDKSLVVVEQTPNSAETRYRLLETVRQYAFEKLTGVAEEKPLRDQHLNFYLALAEDAEPHFYDPQATYWHQRITSDYENISSTLDWADSSNNAQIVLRILGALAQYWFTHGRSFSEWYRRVERALSQPEGLARTSARAKALNGMGFLYWGDVDPDDRHPQLEEALSISRELGDKWNAAISLINMGMIANEQGDYKEARACLEESLVIWQEMGAQGRPEIARNLHFLGDTAMYEGDWIQAESYYQKASVLLRESGNRNVLAFALRRLSQLAWRRGDYKKAKPLCRESLLLNYETDDPRAVIACIAGFADIAVVEGRLEHAACLMAAVEHQLTSFNLRLLNLDQLDCEHYLSQLKDQLDEKAFAKFWSKGKAMSFEEAMAFALEETE